MSSLGVPGYHKMRENSITLATQNWIFRSSSLFQSNCIHRSNEQIKQASFFNFPEMTWLLAKHDDSGLRAEGRGPYNQTPGRLPDKSNNIVFFSFAIAPKYIYLKNVRHKHLLNPMRLALCLAMSSYRIIAQQGNSLVRLSLNWYVMTQIVYVSIFTRFSTLFLDISGEETCRFEKRKKKTPTFFTLWHLKKCSKFHGNLISQL